MLSNILIKLKGIISNYNNIKLTNEQIDLLLKLFKLYNKQIIASDVIKDQLNLTYSETNEFLLYLARKGIVKMNYKVWCENPNNNSDVQIYENIYDVPMDECDVCDKRCKKVNNVVIVYRVKLDE